MPAPEVYSDLLDSPSVVAWFASNCNWKGKGPKPAKLHCIPIGIENRYNEVGKNPQQYFEWMQRRHTVQPSKLLFVGFRSADIKPLREAAVKALSGSWVTRVEHSVERPGALDRNGFLRVLQEHHFAACPPGHGFDTHRLWEVLMAGVFPIVISGPMDSMYEDLPIVVVKAWTDVTHDFLQRSLTDLQSRRTWRTDKIFHKFWEDLIFNATVP
eukprot:Tamp_16921.p2 GENE.Tamp_16921~~Tamp_16921.p2  ORF type:complete len:213 (-),score=18.69 Tamp_16921:108-746(-)